MDAVLTSIHPDAVVTVDYRVRRRKYNDTTLLIRHEEYFEIGRITDSVWLACERSCAVGEIVRTVARTHALPLDQALAATILSLEQFHALGFVSYEVGPAAPATGQSAP